MQQVPKLNHSVLNPVLADARVFLEEKQNCQNEAQAGLCVSTPSSRTELVYLEMNSEETQIQLQDALVHRIPLRTVIFIQNKS